MFSDHISSWRQNRRAFINSLALTFSFILSAVIVGFLEFSWPAFWVSVLAGSIIVLARMFRPARQMVGEYRMERSIWHRCVLGLSFIFLFVPLSISILRGQPDLETTPLSQFSVIAVASTLGGLILAAAARSQWKLDLVRVAQKFIISSVLFIVFIPSIFMVDGILDGIDFDVLEVMDPIAWLRLLYFLLAASSFFIGIVLFLAGLVDLMFALSRIDSDVPMG